MTTVGRFMSDKAPKYHEAFAVASTDFRDAIRNCVEVWGIDWDVETCTWDHVFDEMQRAEDEYENKGLPRKFMRWAGDNATDIDPWLDVLPSEFGGNVLTSALKLITKQQADMRNTIVQAFRTIVDIIMDTRIAREQFKSSAELRTSALTKKMLHKVLRPTLAARELEEVLGAMHAKVHEYRGCLQKVLNATFSRIDSTTRAISNESHMMRALVTDTKIDVGNIKQSVGTISDEARQISLFLKQLQDDYQNAEERRELGSHAQTALCKTLMDEINAIKAHLNAPVAHGVILQDDKQSKSFLHGERLARALGVHHLSPLGDLDYVLQKGNWFTSQAQAQAQQLMSQRRFHHWLISARPDLLLVQADFDLCSRITPLSYLCAHLGLSLANTPGPITLHFFCGQHESRVDSLRGPQGLLRSLITQILHAVGPFDHSFIGTRDYAERIESHITQDLCITFKALIEQLPLNQRVFCFIENILWHESEEWMQDLIDVIEILYRMTHDEHLQPILKVLITSGILRCGIERAIPVQDQVHMVQDQVNNVYGEISERAIMDDLNAIESARLCKDRRLLNIAVKSLRKKSFFFLSESG
ncbi:uncharacterized protein BDV14DRAFT_204973 [Aspergillus stella-maris]|uniref:uncharacterized protein n=1 Tax=Aspergillus stella-maris TaxID=1810926 RepID=UPI003CCCA8CF